MTITYTSTSSAGTSVTHRRIMPEDNVPKLNIKVLITLFQEIGSIFKRYVSKLVK